jgi:hypothetical protein
MENIDPEHWSHSVWDAEHVIASALPSVLTPDIKTSALARVYSLCHLTPCDTCRGHYNAFVASSPPKFETGEDVELWWLNVHNYVSRILGKREWSIDQLRQKYHRNGNYSTPAATKYPLVPYGVTRYGQSQRTVVTKPMAALGYNTQPPTAKQVPIPGWTKPVITTKSIVKAAPISQSKHRTIQAQWQQRFIPARMRTGVGVQTLAWRSMSKKKSGVGLPKKKGCSSCRRKAA